MEEFKAYLGGTYIKDEDWEKALTKVDTNKNGKIDFSEFIMFFENM